MSQPFSGVRAVFFDAVGTLLHPDPPAPIVYADSARRHGLPLSPDDVRVRFLAAYRHEEAADAASNWLTNEERERHRWRTIVTQTLAGVSDPDACFDDLFTHFAQPNAWKLDPDAPTVFSALQASGLVLGLGSNYDSRLYTVLAGFSPLQMLTQRVVVSATIGTRKPGIGFFQEVTRIAGCAASEVLFVGDDFDNDYAGATAAGMRAVLLDPPNRYPRVPHRITRLAELLNTIVPM